MNKLILTIIILVIVVIGGFIGTKQFVGPGTTQITSETPPTSQPTELKTFKSQNLDFEIQIPQKFTPKDDVLSTELESPLGKITIIRNGTNFDNLQDYIRDFDSRRKLTSFDVKETIINGLDSLSRTVNFTQENVQQKSYYIYVENLVYILSTNSKSLYNDLDQIAQSFRYTP